MGGQITVTKHTLLLFANTSSISVFVLTSMSFKSSIKSENEYAIAFAILKTTKSTVKTKIVVIVVFHFLAPYSLQPVLT